jgi:hypothetical protein
MQMAVREMIIENAPETKKYMFMSTGWKVK